jgi:hypothetical protein
MSNDNLNPIEIARAEEQLRQERETFDQQKQHDNLWFALQLSMGYSSIILLAAILMVSSWIIFHADAFSPTVIKSAGAAIFVDALGLIVSVWRVALKPNGFGKLAPVTKVKGLQAAKPAGK